MAATLDVAYDNNSFNGDANSQLTPRSEKRTPKETTIHMRDGDTLQTQLSADGANKIAALSARITVTFYDVSKVISVPAKMIDPSSKERFIQRTLLDKVSGQIHPRQIVALMGPSGSVIVYLVTINLHVDLFRKWENNFIEYIIRSSIEWRHR
jgi:hypothetical protein